MVRSQGSFASAIAHAWSACLKSPRISAFRAERLRAEAWIKSTAEILTTGVKPEGVRFQILAGKLTARAIMAINSKSTQLKRQSKARSLSIGC